MKQRKIIFPVKFHSAFLKGLTMIQSQVKEDDAWKILMDYDSNENNRRGEKKYNESFDINEYQNFIKS